MTYTCSGDKDTRRSIILCQTSIHFIALSNAQMPEVRILLVSLLVTTVIYCHRCTYVSNNKTNNKIRIPGTCDQMHSGHCLSWKNSYLPCLVHCQPSWMMWSVWICTVNTLTIVSIVCRLQVVTHPMSHITYHTVWTFQSHAYIKVWFDIPNNKRIQHECSSIGSFLPHRGTQNSINHWQPQANNIIRVLIQNISLKKQLWHPAAS